MKQLCKSLCKLKRLLQIYCLRLSSFGSKSLNFWCFFSSKAWDLVARDFIKFEIYLKIVKLSSYISGKCSSIIFTNLSKTSVLPTKYPLLWSLSYYDWAAAEITNSSILQFIREIFSSRFVSWQFNSLDILRKYWGILFLIQTSISCKIFLRAYFFLVTEIKINPTSISSGNAYNFCKIKHFSAKKVRKWKFSTWRLLARF